MNYQYDKIVGKAIGFQRKKKGYTQEAFVAKLQLAEYDFSLSKLAKLESGQRHIYLHELKAIKEVLNVSYDDLMK